MKPIAVFVVVWLLPASFHTLGGGSEPKGREGEERRD